MNESSDHGGGGYCSHDDDNYDDVMSMSTDNDNDSSFISNSSFAGTDDSRLFSRASLQMAASTVLDYSNSVSVQAGIYRGRYGNGGTGSATGGGTKRYADRSDSNINTLARNRLPAVFSGTTGVGGGSTMNIPTCNH
jgi:hypothetical protein